MAELISEGIFTYKCEGSDIQNASNYSRKAHWPGGESGVTIGRGYDMKLKTKSKIKRDLLIIGLEKTQVDLLAEGSGKTGQIAKDFVKREDISKIVLTEAQQIQLFNLSFEFEKKETVRVCTKPDLAKAYSVNCDWNKIDPSIRQLLIDLKFRGDYSPELRKLIHIASVSNDFDTLLEVLNQRSHFKGIDTNRFYQRILELENGRLVHNILNGLPSKNYSRVIKSDY